MPLGSVDTYKVPKVPQGFQNVSLLGGGSRSAAESVSACLEGHCPGKLEAVVERSSCGKVSKKGVVAAGCHWFILDCFSRVSGCPLAMNPIWQARILLSWSLWRSGTRNSPG